MISIVFPRSLQAELCRASPEYLQFLRQLNALENSSANRVSAIVGELTRLDASCNARRLSTELGLVAGELPDRWQCTPLGKQVCDGVKQYCNWLEHPYALPRGMNPAMICGRRILDVGCGVGCLLLTCLRHNAALGVGVDMLESSLEMCRVFAKRESMVAPVLVRGDGLALPFERGSFDVVVSRLALSYMNSDGGLREMARVCRAGGVLVICLTTLPWYLTQLRNQLLRGRMKAAAFSVLALLNGVLFHTLRSQLRVRYGGAMYGAHSPIVHTVRTIKRDLMRWGFRPVWDDSTDYPSAPTLVAIRS